MRITPWASDTALLVAPAIDTQSDGAGRFALAGMEAGRHSLITEREGYVRQVDTLEIQGGAVEWTELILERRPSPDP